MIVVRCLSLIIALFVMAAPAFARVDDLPFGAHLPTAQEQAVSDALAASSDSGDPVEKIVLDGVRLSYAARDFGLLWLRNGAASNQMVELRDLMNAAGDDGLDPAAYATPHFATAYPADPAGLAQADVEFSLAVARYVTHLASGRIRPTDVSKLITLAPERPDIGEALSRLSRSAAVPVDLASFAPPHPEYRALKAALAKLRAAAGGPEPVVVPEGKALKPGQSDERVPILRTRLNVSLASDADPNFYDDTLAAAVMAAQGNAGLKADGIVGPRTLAALNGLSKEDEIGAVIANLERWRWMPRDLGAFHVTVNVPEFMVRVVENGAVVHETRVVVGKPTNRTPSFSSAISYLIVNPYWNVPTSILSKEMLPEIQADPYGYFARQGYQVFARVGGRMRQVNPGMINWYAVNPHSVQIRQVPGDDNALGRIKFMFPNQHSVYLHDTPSKRLFERDSRAFSHGCVRVENPLDFADVLLSRAAPDWNSARLEKLYGGPERRVNLETPVPIHLAYFTATSEPDGTLRHFEDIYGYDDAINEALNSKHPAQVAQVSP